ncbi:MAG: hypothetical protein NE328_02425 [Lentisphaeraceae bacterium]|nr:hypothetical protein [Lentisphaeraceae bacterium]
MKFLLLLFSFIFLSNLFADGNKNQIYKASTIYGIEKVQEFNTLFNAQKNISEALNKGSLDVKSKDELNKKLKEIDLELHNTFNLLPGITYLSIEESGNVSVLLSDSDLNHVSSKVQKNASKNVRRYSILTLNNTQEIESFKKIINRRAFCKSPKLS